MTLLGVVSGPDPPPIVVEVATRRRLDPHALLHHVEYDHGIHPGVTVGVDYIDYEHAVHLAARCLISGECTHGEALLSQPDRPGAT